MSNLLYTPIDYQVTPTSFGTWKRYLYQSGMLYQEFTSHARVGRWPLVHIARGRSPETGKIATSRGIIAIGRKAVGVLAIGQLAVGVIAIGQAAFGAFALGQLALAMLVGVGQAALGFVSIGQFAAGAFCIGQFAIGGWVCAKFGFGRDLWALFQQG